MVWKKAIGVSLTRCGNVCMVTRRFRNGLHSMSFRLLNRTHVLTSAVNSRINTVLVNGSMGPLTRRLVTRNTRGMCICSSPRLRRCGAATCTGIVYSFFRRRGPGMFLINTAGVNHSLNPHITGSLGANLATSYARLNISSSGGAVM